MLLFDSCLIPVVWFPIHVGRFPNHPFLHSEASLVSQRSRSRAALVFAKCIHVLLLHFLREMTLCRPPRSSVSWIFDAEHVDIPGHI